jgi:hypothetical protein
MLPVVATVSTDASVIAAFGPPLTAATTVSALPSLSANPPAENVPRAAI